MSDLVHSPSIGLLIAGGIIAALGVWIRSAFRPEPEEKNKRFKLLRRLRRKQPARVSKETEFKKPGHRGNE